MMQDSDGRTPLHLAVMHNSIDVLKLLIEVLDQDSLIAMDNTGFTPYAWAVLLGLCMVCLNDV